MSIKDWYPEVLKLRGHIAELEAGFCNQRDAKEALVERIAELEFKFSSKYWDEVGVEMMKLKAENQRLKEQLQTLIDMHGNGDRQGIIETLEALYTGGQRR